MKSTSGLLNPTNALYNNQLVLSMNSIIHKIEQFLTLALG
jgi:hypothetical protein